MWKQYRKVRSLARDADLARADLARANAGIRRAVGELVDPVSATAWSFAAGVWSAFPAGRRKSRWPIVMNGVRVAAIAAQLEKFGRGAP